MNNLIGKNIRLKRIFNKMSGNIVLVPLDHGVTMGPVEGLKNIKDTMKRFTYSEVDGVILHKGNIRNTIEYLGEDINLIVHLNASTQISPDPDLKTLICTVEEAIQLGADAVSIHINIGSDNESRMLYDFGIIGKKCGDWGIPLLAMMYVRGKFIDNGTTKHIKLAARVASELGADIVKVNFTGDIDSFRSVIEGCSVPIVVAGGEKASSSESILRDIHAAMKVGARGVACGRNAFQHENPKLFCKAVSMIVHDNASVEEALCILKPGDTIRHIG
jgi:predicted phospho-2-dehydro-3-deoxyheptonate aldolase